mgnify:CR=1 FL=1
MNSSFCCLSLFFVADSRAISPPIAASGKTFDSTAISFGTRASSSGGGLIPCVADGTGFAGVAVFSGIVGFASSAIFAGTLVTAGTAGAAGMATVDPQLGHFPRLPAWAIATVTPLPHCGQLKRIFSLLGDAGGAGGVAQGCGVLRKRVPRPPARRSPMDALYLGNGVEVLVPAQHRQPMLQSEGSNPGVIGRDRRSRLLEHCSHRRVADRCDRRDIQYFEVREMLIQPSFVAVAMA